MNTTTQAPSVEASSESRATEARSSSSDWFSILEIADQKLHAIQYPLRAMELPPYPAGGTVGIAATGRALDHIVKAMEELQFMREQLLEYCARMGVEPATLNRNSKANAIADALAGKWITLEEISARRGLNGDFEETLNAMLSERYGALIENIKMCHDGR